MARLLLELLAVHNQYLQKIEIDQLLKTLIWTILLVCSFYLLIVFLCLPESFSGLHTQTWIIYAPPSSSLVYLMCYRVDSIVLTGLPEKCRSAKWQLARSKGLHLNVHSNMFLWVENQVTFVKVWVHIFICIFIGCILQVHKCKNPNSLLRPRNTLSGSGQTFSNLPLILSLALEVSSGGLLSPNDRRPRGPARRHRRREVKAEWRVMKSQIARQRACWVQRGRGESPWQPRCVFTTHWALRTGEDRGDHRCRAAVLHKHLFVLPKELIKHFLDPERANFSPHSWEHMARGGTLLPS